MNPVNPASSLTDAFRALSLNDSASRPLKKVIQVHADDVHALVPFKDGSFVSGSKDTHIRIWNDDLQYIKELAPSRDTTYENWITALYVLPDQSWVSGSRNGVVSFWSAKHELLQQKKYVPKDLSHVCKERNLTRINCLAELPSESQNLFLAGLPTTIQSWDFSKKWCLDSTEIAENDWLYCIKPLGDHRFACVIGSDVEVRKNVQVDDKRWTFEKEQVLYKEDLTEIVGKQRPHISACEFMDQNHLIMSLFSGHIKSLDLETAAIVKSYKEHVGRAWTVCPLSSNVVATGADDGLLKLWDLREKASVATRGPHSGRVSVTLKRGEASVLAASCPADPFKSHEKASFTVWDFRV